MNYSDFVVPDYASLSTFSLILAVVGVLTAVGAFITMLVAKPTKRTIGIVATALTALVVLTVVTAVKGGEVRDRQDAKFAEALNKTYGATSSMKYSDILSHGTKNRYEAELTRAGKATLVRFVAADGKLTPIMLSAGDYPALPAK